jgi:hypothetical protein
MKAEIQAQNDAKTTREAKAAAIDAAKADIHRALAVIAEALKPPAIKGGVPWMSDVPEVEQANTTSPAPRTRVLMMGQSPVHFFNRQREEWRAVDPESRTRLVLPPCQTSTRSRRRRRSNKQDRPS